MEAATTTGFALSAYSRDATESTASAPPTTAIGSPGSPLRRTRRLTRIGSLTIEPLSRDVRVDGHQVRLNPKEYALLRALTAEPTRLFTKSELLHQVWGFPAGAPATSRTVDTHVQRLRAKLGVTGCRFIETSIRVGYRFMLAEDLPEPTAEVADARQLAQDLLALFTTDRPAHPAILEHQATELARAVLEENPAPSEVHVVWHEDDITSIHGTRESANVAADRSRVGVSVERRVLDETGEYLPARAEA